MKRFLAVLLTAVLVLSSAACGGSGSGQSSKAEASKAGQTSQAEQSKQESKTEESKASEPAAEVFAVVNGPDNSYYNNYFASDGKDVYYLNNFKLWKLNMSGDDVKVFDGEDALSQRSDLTGGDGRLFYFGLARKNHDEDGLYSYDTATGTETFLGVTGCSKLYYYGGMVYYSTVDGIGCCKADGTGAKTLVEAKLQYWQLYTDWIYYVTNDKHLWRVKTDGSVNEDTGKSAGHHIIAYQGSFPENNAERIMNTDGEYLYVGTFKGLYRCTSASDPEAGTLIYEYANSGMRPDFSWLHVVGNYIAFQKSDNQWHVVSKDGSQTKDLGF